MTDEQIAFYTEARMVFPTDVILSSWTSKDGHFNGLTAEVEQPFIFKVVSIFKHDIKDPDLRWVKILKLRHEVTIDRGAKLIADARAVPR